MSAFMDLIKPPEEAAPLDVRIWMPNDATYQGNHADATAARLTMEKLGQHIPLIRELVAEHLGNSMVTRVDITPPLHSPMPVDFVPDDDHFRMFVTSAVPLTVGDGPGSITPVMKAIHKKTGLRGFPQGMPAHFEQFIEQHGLELGKGLKFAR